MSQVELLHTGRSVPRWLRAAGTSAAFIAGLLIILLLLDDQLGRRFKRRHGEGLIGPDVYQVAVEALSEKDDRVTTLYLGDSVARQMFRMGHEPDPRVRYLTTNQAISVAGQYYLLRDALVSFPKTNRVNLIYTPLSWSNNLDDALARDYFCAFFHRFDEVCEVLRVTGDWNLAFDHTVRVLLPNLMAANRMSNLRLQSSTDEFLIDFEKPREPNSSSSSQLERIRISKVSAYFLQRIRQLCAERGIALRIVPSICRSDRRFDESVSPYDSAIWYLPPQEFRDGIHLKPLPAELDRVRNEFISRYGL